MKKNGEENGKEKEKKKERNKKKEEEMINSYSQKKVKKQQAFRSINRK